MEGIWAFVKGHWVWFAIGGAVVVGAVIFLRSRSSSSGQTQQDLLVAPATGSGPTPALGTTQTTGPSGINPGGTISPISPVDPVSPLPPVTPVTPSSPDSPVSPVSPGGLATPNIPNPVSGANPSPGTAPSTKIVEPVQPATLGQTTQFATQQPISVNAAAPAAQQPLDPNYIKAVTAAVTPTYVGTPLGPGTPVITGQPTSAAATRVAQTSGGQAIKTQQPVSLNAAAPAGQAVSGPGMNQQLAKSNAGKGGLAGNPSLYG
jgi:hypothetical protein